MNIIQRIVAAAMALALSVPGLAFAQAVSLTEPVQTTSGPVRGVVEGDLTSWRGIPYAAPPIGNLRWRAPIPPRAWSTPLIANAYGSVCAQNADLGVFAKAGGSEDCLNLNVFVPTAKRSSTTLLPVFVWLYGGALRVGAALDYDPSRLAVEGGAIVVTLNYRVGLFGFFAHSAVQEDGKSGVNYGLLDQQLALKWVNDNIARFGGDANNVTIAGESAGGDSVIAHLVSPASRGTFQHAIAMSGTANILKFPTFGAPRPLNAAQKMASDFAEAVHCNTQMAAACLRALPTSQVLAHQTGFTAQQFIVDGKTLPIEPGVALSTGQINPVRTVILGSTRDEGNFFAGYLENESGKPIDESSFPKTMEIFFGDHAEVVMKQYPASAYTSPSEAFAAAATDMLFACTSQEAARRITAKTPAYVYEFADRTAPSYLKPTTFALGAAHTYELAYLFPSFHGGSGIPTTLNPLQKKLASQMVRYWSNPLNVTAPNSGWQPYNAKRQNVMSFVLPTARMTEMSFARAHHCEFWDKLGVY
ncbi:carboxylesterase/lipase family protein [Xanthomonas sp. NCPPB 1325]|uniref:carboxylesterase/lipase family protein n=1 Tax=Xanthomonas sp. NCPPB 1325 TaxID=487529 RepID=UPI003559251B